MGQMEAPQPRRGREAEGEPQRASRPGQQLDSEPQPAAVPAAVGVTGAAALPRQLPEPGPEPELEPPQQGPNTMPHSALTASPGTFFAILKQYRYVILTDLPPSVTAACRAAADCAEDFFVCTDDCQKKQHVCTDADLKCGYRHGHYGREHYHMRVDAAGRQPWPSQAFAAFASELVSELQAVAMLCLAAALRGEPPCPVQNEQLGCSVRPNIPFYYLNIAPHRVQKRPLLRQVLDAFYYRPSPDHDLTAEPIVLQGHNDPGYFTIEPRASAPGLQILEGGTDEWVCVEPMLGPDDLVVFACEELQIATRGEIDSTWHRVSSAPGSSRLALAFELRDYLGSTSSAILAPGY